MKMKYFRFLYGETEQCFLHFAELQDTTEERTYTFLYLRKGKEHVGQAKPGRRLFLFPRHLDLVVVGSADAETRCVLRELLENAEIDTLIVSDGVTSAAASAAFHDQELPAAGKTVRLEGGTYQTELGDWHFLVRAFADGTVAVAHGLSAGVQESGLEDCVMSVKELREEALCRKELSPDGYGCALGCALYQDYDVCKYRESKEQSVFRVGTLLFGGGEDEISCRELLAEARENIGEIRFFGFAAGNASSDAADSTSVSPTTGIFAQIAVVEKFFAEEADARARGFRRYLIGTEALDDQVVAKLGRGGWHQRSIILREDEGICCSGLLKYVQ